MAWRGLKRAVAALPARRNLCLFTLPHPRLIPPATYSRSLRTAAVMADKKIKLNDGNEIPALGLGEPLLPSAPPSSYRRLPTLAG